MVFFKTRPAKTSQPTQTTRTKSNPRLKPVKHALLPGEKPEILIPIEGELSLVTHVDFGCDGRRFGAYLLRMGETKYRLVFGFDTQGIHPNLPHEQVKPIYDRLSGGFKDLPEGEVMTMHMKSFVDNQARLAELQTTIDRCESEVLQHILVTEQKRTQTLTEKGLRKPKSLRIFVTYTFDPEADVKDDGVGAFSKGVYNFFAKFSGAEKIAKTREFVGFLEAGANSFYRWEQILNNKMGLGASPLTVQDMWGDLWSRLNATPAPPVPQTIFFDGLNIREEIDRRLHPLSILIDNESSLPTTDYRWIRAKNKFVGVMGMLDNPDQWDRRIDALNYIWQKLGEDSVYDTEIITQISKESPNQSRKKLKDITDEEIYKATKSAADGEVNVAAQINAQEAVDAQAILHRGDFCLKIASTWLVHRDTVEELDRSCNYLCSLFLHPANLHREYTYTWTTWLQTFPVCWDFLLNYPWDRRGEVFTNCAPGTVPLTLIDTQDRSGFELISEDGGVPIYIDIINHHHHLLWLAKTRMGKSVAITGMLNGVLANGIPVTIVDCPPTKEASTFKDYTKLLGGAYFDVKTESSNIFELPELSHLSAADREDRRKDYEDFLLEILQMLVLGSSPNQIDPIFRDLVRLLLILVMDKFFAAREIKTRYAAAKQQGLGSEAWQQYPILEDFIAFCSPERINVGDGKQIEALRYISSKLTSVTRSPIGQALCRPSTFETDAQLFVMALRGVANAEDMAVLGMVVYGTALRRAYGASKSVLFMDEAAVLLKFPALSLQIGKLCAIGAKAGIRVMLAAQEPQSIAESAGAAQILANTDIKLVGGVESMVSDALINILKIPQELLAPNLTKSYAPNKAWAYSNWLLLDGQSFTRCRIYASPGALAAVVNNVPEVERRQELLAQAEHPILGLHLYATELTSSS